MSSEGSGKEVGCPVCGYRTISFEAGDRYCPHGCLEDHPVISTIADSRDDRLGAVLAEEYGIVSAGGSPVLVAPGSPAWENGESLRRKENDYD